MTSRLDVPQYQEDLAYVAGLPLDWSRYEGAQVLVSGATGMIGTFLTDVLMLKDRDDGLGCQVVALGRSAEKAAARLPYPDESRLRFVKTDLAHVELSDDVRPAVIFHLASTTHPLAYSGDPVGTVTSNLNGLEGLMSQSLARNPDNRFLFASTVEVYGENRGDVEYFDEDYCGYIDCNTLRAGYPESKRLGEALCQAYRAQEGAHPFVPRLPRAYGPTMLPGDSKASSQFLKKALAGQDIVLKSEGTQHYSYLYVADVVAGMLWVLDKGEEGAAYNLADSRSDVLLRDLARMCADWAGTEVVFDLPDEAERAGYSTATKALMDPARAHELGWHARYSMEEGVRRTLEILKETRL